MTDSIGSNYLQHHKIDAAFTKRVEQAALAKGGHVLTNFDSGMVMLLVEMNDHDDLMVWTPEHALVVADGLRMAALAVVAHRGK